MKYIVKNCPAFDSKYNECHSKIEPHKLYCMDCPDCIIKQIVGLCKENQFFNYGAIMLGNGLSADILDILEIKELKQ